MHLLKLITAIVLLATTACGDCVQHGYGIIVDSNTRQPLESVTITKCKPHEPLYKDSYKFYTTKDGQFAASYNMGGLFGCPDLKLYFIKDGYETKELINPHGDTVLLVKSFPSTIPVKKPGEDSSGGH